VHPLLLLRHAGELLHRFLEAGARLRPGDALRRAHQRVRRRVERIERLLRERRGGGGVGITLLELLARLLHLILRVPQGGLELRGDERMPSRRRADLLLDRVGPLFDGGLARARRGARFSIAQRDGDFLLAAGAESGWCASSFVHSVWRRCRSSASFASEASSPSRAARLNSSSLRSSSRRSSCWASARRCKACLVASGSRRASASCSSRSRSSSSGVSARCSSSCTSRSRFWNALSSRPAAFAARAISSTACASS